MDWKTALMLCEGRIWHLCYECCSLPRIAHNAVLVFSGAGSIRKMPEDDSGTTPGSLAEEDSGYFMPLSRSLVHYSLHLPQHSCLCHDLHPAHSLVVVIVVSWWQVEKHTHSVRELSWELVWCHVPEDPDGFNGRWLRRHVERAPSSRL